MTEFFRSVTKGFKHCYIIAEIGVNHNGDVALAKKLIARAAATGADAVKFQTFKTEDVVTVYAEKARYQKKTNKELETQYDMLKKLELTHEDFQSLQDYANKKKIDFLSSPFDIESAEFLDRIGVPAFKIPSGEITNFPLLNHIGRKRKPVIMSTGMASKGEIEQAINALKDAGSGEIALLHCITDYPARIEDANLMVMKTLRQLFKLPVGFSDHTLGITAAIAAATLGACIIEKHFTLDTGLPGPDHRASLNPDDFLKLVSSVREVELALGDSTKKLTRNEKEIKKVARRSIVAAQDIAKGARLDKSMLGIKRPGTGLEPCHLPTLLGKKARTRIRRDSLISWDLIE